MSIYNRKESEHNRGIFWEIPKRILGKFLSIIDGGLFVLLYNVLLFVCYCVRICVCVLLCVTLICVCFALCYCK